MPRPSPYTITVKEAAELAGVSRHVMYRAVKKGEVPVTRLGGRFRILRVPFLRQIGAPVECSGHCDNEGSDVGDQSEARD